MRKAPDEWIGRELAWLGIGLSVGLWVLGTGWVLFAQASEVPYGYQWVAYDMLQPDPSKPDRAHSADRHRYAGPQGLHQGLYAARPPPDGH